MVAGCVEGGSGRTASGGFVGLPLGWSLSWLAGAARASGSSSSSSSSSSAVCRLVSPHSPACRRSLMALPHWGVGRSCLVDTCEDGHSLIIKKDPQHWSLKSWRHQSILNDASLVPCVRRMDHHGLSGVPVANTMMLILYHVSILGHHGLFGVLIALTTLGDINAVVWKRLDGGFVLVVAAKCFSSSKFSSLLRSRT